MDNTDMDFWQQHSLRFLEMALSTEKQERFSRADGHGMAQGACGDTLDIFLLVQDGHIHSASFETNGCLYTVACANTVVRMAEGKTLQEACAIDPEGIVSWLETLPQEEFHCAEIAVDALQKALADVHPGSLDHGTDATEGRAYPASEIKRSSLRPTMERENP